MQALRGWGIAAALAVAAGGAAIAQAGVKEGVDAWQAGDYPRAIAEWRKPADAGDADAQFNLAQAYKLGRGVPNDLGTAQQYYYKAAVQGHEQAQANLGLILFQNGDRRGALPWIQKAAERGEPRAQYVLGTALFNGDIITRDWPRAYALMNRAAAAGLPQATTSLAQMDQHMARKDRDRGLALAREMEKAGSKPAAPVKLASATPKPMPAPAAKPLPTPAPIASPAPRPTPAKTEAVSNVEAKPAPAAKPQPAPVKPAVAAKPAPKADTPKAAVAAKPAPKTDAPKTVAAAKPEPKKAVAAAKPAAAPAGKWRVQLGAYSSAAAARSAWSAMRTSTLASLQPYIVKAGAVHRLQAGPFATRAAAEKACAAARRACFPTGG